MPQYMYIPLLYGKVKLSVLIGSFLVGILPYGPFPRKPSKPVFFLFQKLAKYRVPSNRTEDDDELANSKTNERIQWQPTASDLKHFWLNMFNYFRKYICVQASSINLMKKTERTRQQRFPIVFTSVLFISITKKFSFHILKTISLKIEKKNYCWSAKRSSCTCRQNKLKPLSRLMKTNPKRMLYGKQGRI